MVLALFISRYVMLRVSSIPPKLIFLGCWNIHILEIAIRLLAISSQTSGFLGEWMWVGEGKGDGE